MNAKNFVLAGLAGGIVDFLLGWLLQGTLFREHYPEMNNFLFVILGCLSFGMFISYIFVRWANLVTFTSGLMAGATIGLFIGLISNFFMRAGSVEVDYTHFAMDLAIGIVIGACVGAAVAAVNGALSKQPV